MTISAFRTLVVLLFASTLAACGGGGGGAAGGSALPSTPTAGTTTTTVTPTVTDANVTQLAASGSTISGAIRAGSHKAIVAVMSGAGDLGSSSTPSFAQDALALDATAVSGASQSALRSTAAAAPHIATPVEAFPADDARAQRLRQSLTPSTGPAPVVRATQSIASAAVGSTAPVWVEKSSLGSSSGAYQQVPATLEVQTAHGNIWIDNTLLSGSTASSSFTSGALASTVATIGSDFENAYASDTAHFATTQYSLSSPGLSQSYKACNADGSSAGTTAAYIAPPSDGRINVMVVNPRSFGTGMGGYFSSVNYMPQVALNCISSSYHSNEAPFIYVGWFDSNGATYELKEDLVRGTAHELQHLINFVNHSVLGSAGSYEETFINEGLSMLAQDLAVAHLYGSVQYDADDAVRRAQAYLSAPQNFSVSGFIGIDSGSSVAQYNCGSGCYGSAYLFQRYLYDRLGGDAYTHGMETSSTTGAPNISRAASGESFSQVLDDFGLALAASTAGVTPKDSRYAFGLNLTGTHADQFGGSTTLTGVAALPMSGSVVQVQAPLGGFAFVGFGSIPAAGQSFTITDRATVGGFAPVGGLVQQ